jgi:uncharacterized protein (DUF1778 family)
MLPHKIKLSIHLIFGSKAMTIEASTKAARLEARISLEGRTLTDFVVASVQAAAYKVIEQHQTLKLNMEDSEAFVDALLNPPKPNDALKSAALRYKQVMSD